MEFVPSRKSRQMVSVGVFDLSGEVRPMNNGEAPAAMWLRNTSFGRCSMSGVFHGFRSCIDVGRGALP